MASWEQLVDYVGKNYNVADQNERMLLLSFAFDDNRTQRVFVWHAQMGNGEEWIQIESPIGELTEINLRTLLALVGDKVVGGAAAVQGYVVLRHSAPLADMSVEEFEAPFQAIIGTADQLEYQLTGVDQY